jgi:hypothetical protein
MEASPKAEIITLFDWWFIRDQATVGGQQKIPAWRLDYT